jgi:hypothetical protein
MGKRSYYSPKRPDQLWGPTHTPIQRVPGFVPGVERPGHEVSHIHLVPSLRMSGAKLVLPFYVFMAWRATPVLRVVMKRTKVQGTEKCVVK